MDPKVVLTAREQGRGRREERSSDVHRRRKVGAARGHRGEARQHLEVSGEVHTPPGDPRLWGAGLRRRLAREQEERDAAEVAEMARREAPWREDSGRDRSRLVRRSREKRRGGGYDRGDDVEEVRSPTIRDRSRRARREDDHRREGRGRDEETREVRVKEEEIIGDGERSLFEGVRWIASKGCTYSMCAIDADDVPLDILTHAKLIAGNVLNLEHGIDAYIVDFPHWLDGGWPGVDPEDDHVMYAQVRGGVFDGLSAVARGSPKLRRERGVALALVLAAAVEFPHKVSGGMLEDQHVGLSRWTWDAKQQLVMLTDEVGSLSKAAAAQVNLKAVQRKEGDERKSRSPIARRKDLTKEEMEAARRREPGVRYRHVGRGLYRRVRW